MSRWSERNDVRSGADYDTRWTAMEAAGESIHGEADLVSALLESYACGPQSAVLDAGCGTGRVAIELDRRGISVVGVDLDASMLSEAKLKAPHLRWLQGDLCDVDLGRKFDLIVMAGNVMIFVANQAPRRRCWPTWLVISNPEGLLLAGFQLGRLSLDDYDRHALPRPV